jgi:hypothetical protein
MQDKAKNEMEAIQLMIHQRLRANPIEALAQHPDEDTLCAFMEGYLDETRSSEMVSHLIACGSCRRTTAQFSRESDVDDEPESAATEAGPGRLREMLEGLASKILPSGQEHVVFAYQDPGEEVSENREPTASSNKDTEDESD